MSRLPISPHLPVTEKDQAELEKFSRYLREMGAWDRAHTSIPHTHAGANQRIRDRLKAEVEIYERIYGEKI